MVTLYKKDTKERIRVLHIVTDGPTLSQVSGLAGGKLTTTSRECTPKNIGKVNETTPEAQAILEAQALVTKKLKEGYFRTTEEARNYVNLMPMLATTLDLSNIQYPVFASRKLDGIRCVATNKQKLTRKNREITTVNHIDLSGLPDGTILDGELYVEDVSFQSITSWVKRKQENTLKVQYYVYDLPSHEGTYIQRLMTLDGLLSTLNLPNVHLVSSIEVHSLEKLKEIHSNFVANGDEGTMIRTDDTGYEFAKRSKSLRKYKDFIDEVYEIIDVVPMDKRPEQGMVVCKMKDGQVFDATPKMSFEEREELLINKQDVIGQMAEIRFFEFTDGGKPRFPVYCGTRIDK